MGDISKMVVILNSQVVYWIHYKGIIQKVFCTSFSACRHLSKVLRF